MLASPVVVPLPGVGVDKLGHRLAQLEREAQAAAALVELTTHLALAATLDDACRQLAGEIQACTGVTTVAIGLLTRGRGNCRLKAVSGMPDFDVQGDLAARLQAALAECCLNKTLTSVPASCASEGLTIAAQVELGPTLRVPLCAGEKVVGAVLCMAAPERIADPELRHFLQAASEPLGAGLTMLERSVAPAWATRLSRWFTQGKLLRKRLIIPLAMALCLTLAVPLPYKVTCDCQVQPVVRRYVSAPYAGIFEKSLVKPGDMVHKDQVLAVLDGRELRWELAGLAADQQRAAKSRDMNMATGKAAAAQIDKLEMERLEHRRQLLLNRTEHLEIRSPVDGIVVSGDLERAEGAPLTVGQTLFEIAPLQRMIAELSILDDEIAHVGQGQEVKVAFDAYPDSRWPSTLDRIHPRSETRDEANVFIGEVPLENPVGALRPGMKGQATIVTPARSLAWILFHKPWERIAGWLW